MPPPTPELSRKTSATSEGATAVDTFDETVEPEEIPDESRAPSARMPSARESTAATQRQRSAISQRARTSFLRPATSLMRPKSGAHHIKDDWNYDADDLDDNDEESEKARELMEYLLDGKRVKDVPDCKFINQQFTQI